MKSIFKFMLPVLTIALVIACGKEPVDPPTPTPTPGPEVVTISGLDFTVVTNEENPLQVLVTPSATNATAYKIYFDLVGSPSAFENTSGSGVLHTYPEATATYTIKVTASADNAEDVSLEKEHTITVAEATVIHDFETVDPPYFLDDNTLSVDVVAGGIGDNATAVGKISNSGALYEAAFIVNTKLVDLTTANKVISLDFYQETAGTPDILLKLEGNSTEGGFDVEVLKTAAGQAGWQTIEFDFNNAANSYPNHENATVTLSQYQKVVVFIGFNSDQFAGDFYIDNLVGAEFGDDQPDTDSDGIFDAIDGCPSGAGSAENNGCPDGPTAAAAAPTKAEADILNIYSDAYTNPSVTTYQTSWSANASIEQVEIAAGENALKATISAANGYGGIQFADGTAFDVTAYNSIHFDVFTSDMDNFRFKLEGAVPSEAIEATIDVSAKDQWVSVDLALSAFGTNSTVLTDAKLAVISAAAAGQVFIDNIYLYNDEGNNGGSETQALQLTVTAPASATSVRLTGPWWEWNTEGGPVGVSNNDNTWTFTFDPAPTENMEYLYIVDGVQENLVDNAAGNQCVSRIDGGRMVTDYANYANRVWVLGSGNQVESYDSCD